MVSTRGVKLKFLEGERVLCYEPDPTKAKVLYDSKVLEVIVNKDQRGRKSYEYLIHFQGWNSSWDRCVGEEYVLKDTAENRQLQKDLAEKSQLQLGAYLYRKERKKHSRKPSDRTTASSEDGSSGSPGRMDLDETQRNDIITSSSEEDSSTEDDTIQIDLTPDLREILENDFYNIKDKNKLVKLPAEPNVVTILESYYRHYATNQLCGLNDKSNRGYRNIYHNQQKLKPEDIQKNLTICREVMDGLRIYFDFNITDVLLYKPEQGQIETKQAIPEPSIDLKLEIKSEGSSPEYSQQNNSVQEDFIITNGNNENKYSSSRRRTLRSNRSDSHTNGNAAAAAATHETPNNNPKPGSSVGSSNSDTTGPIAKTLSWRVLPEYVYNQHPPPPCLVYGAIHLTRLLVRLPDLLMASNIAENKLKVLLRHIDLFIDFLNERKEWYGDKVYIDKLS